MPNPLSPETLEQIQQIAGQIQVANQLDPEIQAELRSHMEDKVAAYLSGQEKVTEADALFLMRVHFGDPAIIKSLFQGVHHREYSISLARRLAAAFVASTLVGAPLSVVGLINFYFLSGQPIDSNTALLTWLATYMVPIACAGLLWLIFTSWRRSLDRHQALWFQTCRPWVLCAVVFAAWGVAYSGPQIVMVCLGTYFPLDQVRRIAAHQAMDADLSTLVAACRRVFFSGVIAIAWIWWCDQKPRTEKTVFHAAVGCLTAGILSQLLGLGALLLETCWVNAHVDHIRLIGLTGETIFTTILPSTVFALAGYLLWYRLRRQRSALAA